MNSLLFSAFTLTIPVIMSNAFFVDNKSFDFTQSKICGEKMMQIIFFSTKSSQIFESTDTLNCQHFIVYIHSYKVDIISYNYHSYYNQIKRPYRYRSCYKCDGREDKRSEGKVQLLEISKQHAISDYVIISFFYCFVLIVLTVV